MELRKISLIISQLSSDKHHNRIYLELCSDFCDDKGKLNYNCKEISLIENEIETCSDTFVDQL